MTGSPPSDHGRNPEQTAMVPWSDREAKFNAWWDGPDSLPSFHCTGDKVCISCRNMKRVANTAWHFAWQEAQGV